LFIWTVLLLIAAPDVRAERFTADPSRSVLAIVTHKAGIAKRFAHDHFITADEYSLTVDFDEGSPLQARAALELRADRLVVDGDVLRRHWYPRLAELGLLEEPFGEIDSEDRDKIRTAMLSGKQLDAEHHPWIRARVLDLRERPGTVGDTTFAYQGTLELEIHGTKVRRPVALRHEIDDSEVTVEGVATFRFSQFGIKPYSAMLGAVRNRDEFRIFAHVVLTKVEEQPHID
jgi:hypothetical protein